MDCYFHLFDERNYIIETQLQDLKCIYHGRTCQCQMEDLPETSKYPLTFFKLKAPAESCAGRKVENLPPFFSRGQGRETGSSGTRPAGISKSHNQTDVWLVRRETSRVLVR